MDDLPTIGRPNAPAPAISSHASDAAAMAGSLEGQAQVANRSPWKAPPVHPYARTLTRVPFELYQDQLDTLRRFSLDEKAHGEKGSMSQMAREALDMYIAKRLRKEE